MRMFLRNERQNFHHRVHAGDGPTRSSPLTTVEFEAMDGLTYLEIDDDEDDEDCGEQIAYIRRVLPIESLLQGVELVRLGQQEVEESNDGALELSALLRADGDGRETLPEDDFTDVGGNEEGDAAAKTVALLEELIEEDNDDAGQGELEDDDDAVDHADFVDGTVHAREKVSESLTDGDND